MEWTDFETYDKDTRAVEKGIIKKNHSRQPSVRRLHSTEWMNLREYDTSISTFINILWNINKNI